MSIVYKGGCAVMLACRASGMTYGLLEDRRHQWSAATMFPSLLELHTTVQFVGRDLDATQVKDVIAATFEVFTTPVFLHFTGHLLSWGTKKGRYLVAEVSKSLSPELLTLRNELRERLGHLHIRDDFEYNPHMTIAEGLPGPKVMPPFGVDPFELFCTEVEVKYGNQTMKVNLL